MVASPLSVSPGCDIVEQAQERLRAAPYIFLHDVRCEYRQGLLILRGQVASYYEKQLAQEAVAGSVGVAQVVNEIEVAWDDPNLQWRPVR
jgi:osmotically-inducible protein OsmY